MANVQIPVAEFLGEIDKPQLAVDQKSVLFITVSDIHTENSIMARTGSEGTRFLAQDPNRPSNQSISLHRLLSTAPSELSRNI
jgi:hypothetical protein